MSDDVKALVTRARQLADDLSPCVGGELSSVVGALCGSLECALEWERRCAEAENGRIELTMKIGAMDMRVAASESRELDALADLDRALAERDAARAQTAAWRTSLEEALGIAHDEVNHTSDWALTLIGRIREMGNAYSAGRSLADRLAKLERVAEAARYALKTRVDFALKDAIAALDGKPQAVCQCHWEAGDSPCPIHGDESGDEEKQP